MDVTPPTFQGNQQQPIEETRIPSLKESMLAHQLDQIDLPEKEETRRRERGEMEESAKMSTR